MKRILLGAALFLAALVPAQAAKLTKANCEAIWNDARPKGSDLNAELAKPFVTDFKTVDTNGDKHISSDEFFAGCEKDLVHASTASSPATGASPAK